MEYFLQNAHHHLKQNLLFVLNGLLVSLHKFCTNGMIWSSGFFVRRLYGGNESQQNSNINFSSDVLRPASSNTCIRFDLPNMLSYRVPFGILYRTDACVKRSFCVTTAFIASRNWACVHVGGRSFRKLEYSEKYKLKILLKKYVV